MTNGVTRGALTGYRVVDFSRLAPGTLATTILADLGADVIRIEEPGGGQRARQERELSKLATPLVSPTEQDWRTYSPLERNKRSIVLNLKQPAGREVALQIVRSADVVVEGFRPGVMARLGFDYETVRSINPGIVYCSISGYGQEGDHAGRTGHDLNYLAYAGALSLIGTPDGRPVVPINLIADYAAGSLPAVAGILAALLARTSDGLGQFVDVAMADGVVALLGVEVARLQVTGQVPRAGTMYLTGGAAYYNVYRSSDDKGITIACNEPHFFAALCEAIGSPELVDLQFGGRDEQRRNYEKIQQKIGAHDLAHWMEVLGRKNVPFEPVRGLDEVVADPASRRRGVIVDIPSGSRTVTQAAPIIRLSRTPASIRSVGRAPGSDTHSILAELGRNDDDIDRLRESGAFGA